MRRPVLLRCSKTANQAMMVLSAALRAEPDTRGARLTFVQAPDLAAALRAGTAEPAPLVLWSFYSTELGAIAPALLEARAAHPDAVHVAGGPHPSAEPAATLALGFDFVAVGEGEAIIVEMVKRIDQGRSLAGIAGLGHLDERGGYRSHGLAERHPLDRFPAHNAQDRRFGPIEITRGCIYACKFCQTPYLQKARFRHRSVENVRAHVRRMREHGLGYVRFVSPSSLSYGAAGEEPSLDAVVELLAGVRAELGPRGKIFFGTFPSEVRPEHVSAEALLLLRRYVDNDNLVIGGQSGSERLLRETRRGHDVGSVVRAAELCKRHGFRANVDLLFGLPGEREEDGRATAELMRRLSALGARVHTHTFMPLPGTPLAAAGPSAVADPVRAEVGRLEARGLSYGNWREQLVLADQLARRRRASDRGRNLAKGEA